MLSSICRELGTIIYATTIEGTMGTKFKLRIYTESSHERFVGVCLSYIDMNMIIILPTDFSTFICPDPFGASQGHRGPYH